MSFGFVRPLASSKVCSAELIHLKISWTRQAKARQRSNVQSTVSLWLVMINLYSIYLYIILNHTAILTWYTWFVPHFHASWCCRRKQKKLRHVSLPDQTHALWTGPVSAFCVFAVWFVCIAVWFCRLLLQWPAVFIIQVLGCEDNQNQTSRWHCLGFRSCEISELECCRMVFVCICEVRVERTDSYGRTTCSFEGRHCETSWGWSAAFCHIN